MNRVPLFSWLSTRMVPFIICTRFLVMASPSPVPWTWLTRESSARSKGMNSFSRNSGAMPIPSSSTTNSKHPTPLSLESFSSRDTAICPLSGVYFTALDSRLMSICLTRTASPYTAWWSMSFKRMDSSCPLLSISGLTIRDTSSTNSFRQKASSLSPTLPDSIFDISSTLLIKSRRWLPERLILDRQSSILSRL